MRNAINPIMPYIGRANLNILIIFFIPLYYT
jgi:hypothetical protein